jgi:hypothetical protein
MATFLRIRNGNYYLRLRVPADLRSTFPEDTEILKSLRTKDPKTARLSASCLRPRFLEVFTLTRCGFITDEQARKRIAEMLNRQPKEVPSPQVDEEPVRSPSAPYLKKVIEQYTADQKSAWTPKTALEYESYFKLLVDIVGDQTVTKITRDVVRDLRDTLTKLPPHVYKKHPGMTIQQVIELPNITPMSITTVNKLLRLFGTLMRHSIKEGYRTDNPVEGLKVQQNRRADEERKAYSREDLKKITVTLPSPAKRPERYWVPMIGMYSGMRLWEICGLHIPAQRSSALGVALHQAGLL